MERLIEGIASKHPEMSKNEISLLLQKERQKTGGLISDETLMRIIAWELGVDFKNDAFEEPSMSIVDLVPNLNNVTVSGRVVGVFKPRVFEGRKSGKIASLLIVDSKAILRVVLWNDKATLIENETIKARQFVKFSHCYTKEDRFGKTELHAGEKCEIDIGASESKDEEFPEMDQFLTKISQVKEFSKNTRVHVRGTIGEIFPSSIFERKDGSPGKVMRIVLADGTGEVSVVLWNEKVEELVGFLHKGSRLRILGGKTKTTLARNVEIHVNSESLVEVFSFSDEHLDIADLKEGASHVNVRGEIAAVPVLKEVNTSSGEQVKLVTFELKDETGRITVSAWREHAITTCTLKNGDRVELRDVFVKKGFRGGLEIATRNGSSILICS